MRIIPVSEENDELLGIYTRLNEKQLKRIYEPDDGLFVCESVKVIRRAMDAGYMPQSFLIESGREKEVGELLSPDDECSVYVASHQWMREITGYALTGGVLAAMYRKREPSFLDICKGARRLVILDDIENPTNVGAIFRSAAALGMDGVLLTKGCSDPLYRRCARVSMGTVFQIPWAFAGNDVVEKLQQEDFRVVALALDDRAVGIDELEMGKTERLALVLGNEEQGVSERILSRADCIAKIPMADGVDSLNVAAASAVAFWVAGRGKCDILFGDC